MSLRNLILLIALAAGCCSCATAGKVTLVVGPAADLASTQWAKGQGAVEANPLIGQGDARLYAIKAGQVGLLLWLDSHLKHHSRAQMWLRIIAGGVNGGVAAHNVKVGLEAQHAKR